MTTTADTLFDGRLVCSQHRDGYRFSVDAVLAAHFCRPQEQDRILDIGCGCGVISLILCYRFSGVQTTGLELQPGLAKLARANSTANRFQHRFSVLEGDLRMVRKYMQPESFDLVVSNPPYRRSGSGRVNREGECAIARHELTADLQSVVSAAAFSVKNRGTVVFIYPAERSATLIAAMLKQRLVPKRMQPVYSYPEDERARLVLLEAVKNSGEGLHLLAPFYIYQYTDGPYTSEMAELYQQ